MSAETPGQVWCLDFCFDACLNGTKLKVLAIVDEFTRECLAHSDPHQLQIPACAAGPLPAVRRARRSDVPALRQRQRVHLQKPCGVPLFQRGWKPLHQTRLTLAERLCPELQFHTSKMTGPRFLSHSEC